MWGLTAYRSSAISLLFDEERRQFGDDEVDRAVAALDELLDLAVTTVAAKGRIALARDESSAQEREDCSRAMALAKLLFRDRRFGFRCRDRAGDFTLTGTLRQRGGNCLGLTTLYCALASEVELPVAPLLFEGHIAACLMANELRRPAPTLAADKPRSTPHCTLTPDPSPVKREGSLARNLSAASLGVRPIELSRSGGFLPKRVAELMYGRSAGRVLTDDEFIAVHLSNRGAFLHVPSGELESAMAAFDRALELFPEYVGARINRATLLLHLEQPEEAADELERILDLGPGPRYRRIAADLLIQVVARSTHRLPIFAPASLPFAAAPPPLCKGGQGGSARTTIRHPVWNTTKPETAP